MAPEIVTSAHPDVQILTCRCTSSSRATRDGAADAPALVDGPSGRTPGAWST